MESHSKVCTKCKEEKPLEAFSKHRARKDGLQIWCKVCLREYAKQYYEENRENIKQYNQKTRRKRLEYFKQYHQKNREKKSEYDKKYHQKNREEKLEYKKQHRQENREKYAARNAKRSALKRDAVPEALLNCPTEKDRLEKTYKLRDLLTKATGVEYHVDHIWPLSKGGPHWSGNLQVITAKENLSKHASFCEDTARVIQESLDEYISNRQ